MLHRREATLPLLKGGATVGSLSVTSDLTEGTIAADLTAIQDKYPQVDIGSYPQYVNGKPQTTLVCRSMDAAANKAAHDEVRAMVKQLGGTEIAAPAA